MPDLSRLPVFRLSVARRPQRLPGAGGLTALLVLSAALGACQRKGEPDANANQTTPTATMRGGDAAGPGVSADSPMAPASETGSRAGSGTSAGGEHGSTGSNPGGVPGGDASRDATRGTTATTGTPRGGGSDAPPAAPPASTMPPLAGSAPRP
jgi:hypothetical protein